MTKEKPLYYRIDDQNRIIEVGGSWNDAAREGDAESLTADRVEGTNLFSYITGEATRGFVWAMLDAVRKLHRPSKKLYRCDTPTLKRQMEMRIYSEDNTLLVEHSTKSIEAFDMAYKFRTSVSNKTADAHLIRCSICNDLRLNDEWVSPEQHPDVSDNKSSRLVVYSVCPDCQSNIKHLRHK